jgi:uncharacterized protein YjbJ (UPF0337 family)
MNKDHVKGGMKDIAGKAQEKAGKMTGSTEHQVKGMAKQVEGKAQKAFGDVKDAANEADDKDGNR